MPRVDRKTKNRGGTKTYHCSKTGCGKPILPGQGYYTWKFRNGGRYFQHTDCGYPKPSQLSNSKIAQVDDAIDDFGTTVGQAETVDEIKEALEAVASTARDVAQEYIDSADNIESAWPSGNPTSEACRATGEELEAWADTLEGWEPDNEEPDEEEHEDEDELAEARDNWLEECRDQARQLMDEKPEYQG